MIGMELAPVAGKLWLYPKYGLLGARLSYCVFWAGIGTLGGIWADTMTLSFSNSRLVVSASFVMCC